MSTNCKQCGIKIPAVAKSKMCKDCTIDSMFSERFGLILPPPLY